MGFGFPKYWMTSVMAEHLFLILALIQMKSFLWPFLDIYH